MSVWKTHLYILLAVRIYFYFFKNLNKPLIYLSLSQTHSINDWLHGMFPNKPAPISPLFPTIQSKSKENKNKNAKLSLKGRE